MSLENQSPHWRALCIYGNRNLSLEPGNRSLTPYSRSRRSWGLILAPSTLATLCFLCGGTFRYQQFYRYMPAAARYKSALMKVKPSCSGSHEVNYGNQKSKKASRPHRIFQHDRLRFHQQWHNMNFVSTLPETFRSAPQIKAHQRQQGAIERERWCLDKTPAQFSYTDQKQHSQD